MGWIIMQPADDKESVVAAIHLLKTGICLFDISISGARLKPIAFGSRGCDENEKLSFFYRGRCMWLMVHHSK